jgi:hypothetical protein
MSHFGRIFFRSGRRDNLVAEEAAMKKPAIVTPPKRRRLACIATGAGALLGAFAAASPAHSGEFYNDRSYGAPYEYRAAYRPHCWQCGCGGWRCGCGGWRCGRSAHRGHIIERRYVEREYTERRYVGGGYHHARSYRYPAYGYGYPSGGYADRRFPYGYGGVRWQQAPYDYDEDAPRPPAPVRSDYDDNDYRE